MDGSWCFFLFSFFFFFERCAPNEASSLLRHRRNCADRSIDIIGPSFVFFRSVRFYCNKKVVLIVFFFFLFLAAMRSDWQSSSPSRNQSGAESYRFCSEPSRNEDMACCLSCSTVNTAFTAPDLLL